MRGRANVLYWATTGSLVGLGLIGLMSIGIPFVIVGLIVAVVGVWRPGIGGAWGLLIGRASGAHPSVAHSRGCPDGVEPVLRPAGRSRHTDPAPGRSGRVFVHPRQLLRDVRHLYGGSALGGNPRALGARPYPRRRSPGSPARGFWRVRRPGATERQAAPPSGIS